MSEIGLQDLIYQVKRELLAPNPRERARDPYPLFLIDKIELEIAVRVSKVHNGGIKLTVLDFVELTGSSSIERENAHVITISLSPLLPREAILLQSLQNPEVKNQVEERTYAWIKGDENLAGDRE